MPACPRCKAANDEGRLRCTTCGNALAGAPAVTRKLPGPVLTTGNAPTADVLKRDRADPNDQTGPIARPVLVPPPGGRIRAPAPAPRPAPKPPSTGPLVVAYLVSTVLEKPYELRSTDTVEIGRGDENDIVLPVHQVSRLHALIKWDGGSFTIMDRGSTNGIFVNGEAVQQKRLQVGDLIAIGPFDLTFQAMIDAGQAPKQEETVVVSTPGSFAGELSEVSVSEICQLIELNQKTGILDFHHGDRRGKVYFEKGRAAHAEYGGLVGEEAALELFSLTRGGFRFMAKDRVTVKKTIKRPTGSLLMEAARRADEAR